MAKASHPSSCALPGTKLIEPLRQGDLDGLCALYCLMNAIRLVMAPHRLPTRLEERALFAEGARFPDQNEGLPEAVHSCVSDKDWLRLAAQMVATARAIANRPIFLEKPKLPKNASVKETLSHIEGLISSGKAPCVFFRGKSRHYSVISGYTPFSLKLFDSFEYNWFLRRRCGTTRTTASLHRIHIPSIIAFAVL